MILASIDFIPDFQPQVLASPSGIHNEIATLWIVWQNGGMAKRPRRPASSGPPDGATEALRLLIELYDRQDGEAADWKLIADALFKAAFIALDKIPFENQRLALARRVHEGSYNRMTGDVGSGAGQGGSDAPAATPAPSNTADPAAPAPRAPR
jgi:hypothetical protein